MRKTYSGYQKSRRDIMYGPRILMYMAIVFAVFAFVTYVVSESLWTTLLATTAFAICVQIGYVITIVYHIVQHMNTRMAVLRARSYPHTQDEITPDQEPKPVRDHDHCS